MNIDLKQAPAGSHQEGKPCIGRH